MPRVKQASRQKRVTKAAIPALGAAGLTFSLLGSASALAVPTADVPQTTHFAPRTRQSRSARKNWPTSVSLRSISSIRKPLAATCKSRGAAAAVAAVAVVAVCVPAGAVAAGAAAVRALGAVPLVLGTT